MSYSHCERLSALDQSFLELETLNAHMHVASISLYENGPLVTPEGGIAIDRIRAVFEHALTVVPRYRQKLVWSPGFHHPVWVDDPHFNLNYHLRHTHLPRPGDERQLKRLAGRLFSQALDRGKPLWEMTVVEGVEGDRFAVISKLHHCMLDGASGNELSGTTMRWTPEPDPELDRPAPKWVPRPAPSPSELFLGELAHRAQAPLVAFSALRRAATHPSETAAAILDVAEGMRDALFTGIRPASPTPLNIDIGPHRRFDYLDTDLATVKKIKNSLGGTINDVVLAALSGALRRFLRQRGIDVEKLEFRAMIPVNVRAPGDTTLGNQVAMLVARLPLGEREPRGRLGRVITETRALKRSHQADAIKVIEEIGDWTSPALLAQSTRMAARTRPFNIVVTNVPGPPMRLYMAGAAMIGTYPAVPLYQNQALGVALFSYAGRLCWGFQADWDAVPDLHDLVDAVAAELETLAEIADRASATTAGEQGHDATAAELTGTKIAAVA